MKNPGKKFEEDFIKSLDPKTWHLRLKDAGGWSKSEDTRFTISNPCDFLAMIDTTLYMIELKSHKGKSIPFSCLKQAEGLFKKHTGFDSVRPIFVFNFRDSLKTYAVSASMVWLFMQDSDRKSIPESYCKEAGIEIQAILKRVRYRYQVEEALKKS